jgi:hypothetical protein
VNGIAILIALSAAFKIQFSVIQRVGYDVVLYKNWNVLASEQDGWLSAW